MEYSEVVFDFAFAISGNGHELATVRNSNIVKLWNIDSGAQCGRIDVGKNIVSKIAYSSDSRNMALVYRSDGRTNDKIALWDIESRKLLRTITCGGGVWSLAFAGNNKSIFAQINTQSRFAMAQYDLNTGTCIRRRILSGINLYVASISSNNLIAVTPQNEVEIMDSQFKHRDSFRVSSIYIGDMAFLNDKLLLYSGTDPTDLNDLVDHSYLYDIAKGKTTDNVDILGHVEELSSARYAPRLAIMRHDGTIDIVEYALTK
ncbi:MAG: WD40 repeat domain-containing protein [Capsulimonadaceae bacterium]|nr:WD40 repeat domain-containing protein [Capsulimonadaceae bacterium]